MKLYLSFNLVDHKQLSLDVKVAQLAELPNAHGDGPTVRVAVERPPEH